MTKTKRAVSFFLALFAFVLFCCGPLCQSAYAVAIFDDFLLAVIIAAITACGISFFAQGGYNQVSDYIASEYAEFCYSRGVSIEQSISGVQYGRNSLGNIVVNNRFLILVDTFIAWLVSKHSIENNTTVVMTSSQYIPVVDEDNIEINIPTASFDNGQTPVVYSDSYFNIFALYHGFEVNRVYRLSSGYYLEFVYDLSQSSGNKLKMLISTNQEMSSSVYEESFTGGNTQYAHTYNDPYVNGNQRLYFESSIPVFKINNQVNVDRQYMFGSYATYVQLNSGSYAMLSGNRMTVSLFNTYFQPVTDQISVNAGDVVGPLSDNNYHEGDGAIIDVGASWGETLPDILSDDIPDAYVAGGELDASIDYVGEEEIEETVTDAGDPSVDENPESYESPGLADVFPFCIPFDIYAFFECLAAEPEAPSFTWRFYVPGICDEEFVVDLAPFDTVAQIVRTMELLAFIVGLALVTRDKFLRG